MEQVLSLMREYPGAGAILITGQMSGCTLVDDAGVAVRPIISWQDQRCGDLAQITAALGPQLIAELGNELRPGLPIATLNLLNRGESVTAAQPQFTSLLGFVAGQLAGTAAKVAHPTDAAASGMWSLTADWWNERALTIAHLSVEQVPQVRWDLAALGTSSTGATIYAPIGDQQASLLGAGLRPDTPNLLSMNIATGGQVSAVQAPGFDPVGIQSLQRRPFLDHTYLLTRTHLPSGRALTKVLELLSRRVPTDEDWAWAVQACTQSPGPDAASAPSWDPKFFTESGGSLHGIRAGTSAQDCMQSAVAALASGFVQAARQLDTGQFDNLVFSGGLIQKFAPLREAICSEIDLPCSVHPGDDAALDGLAVLAQRYL